MSNNNYYKNIITTIIVLALLALLLVMSIKNLSKSDNISSSEPKIVKQGKLGDDIEPRRYFIYEYNIDGKIYYDMEIID